MTKTIRREFLLEIKDKLQKTPSKEFVNGLYDLLGKTKPKEDIFEQYPELEEVLEEIGDNPVKEKELAWEKYERDDIVSNGFSYKYAKLLKKAKDIDLSNYPAKIGKQFAGIVALKVNDKKDEFGAYKYVDSFKDLDLTKVDVYEVGELFELMEEKEKKQQLASLGYDEEVDDFDEYLKDVDALTADYEEQMFVKALKITGIKGKLSVWEKNLLVLNILAEAGMIKGKSFTKESL